MPPMSEQIARVGAQIVSILLVTLIVFAAACLQDAPRDSIVYDLYWLSWMCCCCGIGVFIAEVWGKDAT